MLPDKLHFAVFVLHDLSQLTEGVIVGVRDAVPEHGHEECVHGCGQGSWRGDKFSLIKKLGWWTSFIPA